MTVEKKKELVSTYFKELSDEEQIIFCENLQFLLAEQELNPADPN